MPGFNFATEHDARRTINATKRVEASTTFADDDSREVPRRRIQVKLLEDLDGTDDYNAPTSARALRLFGKSGADDLADGTEEQEITLWNRTNASLATDDYTHAVEVDDDYGKWYADIGGAAEDSCKKCCEFVFETDVTLGDGTKTRTQYQATISTAEKRGVRIATSDGNGFCILPDGDYLVNHSTYSGGVSPPPGGEGWYASLSTFVIITDLAGDDVTGSSTLTIARMDVFFETIETHERVRLRIWMDATVPPPLVEE